MTRANNFLSIAILFLISFIPYSSYGQLPYLEDFAGENNKGAIGASNSIPTIDVSGVDWAIDVSAATLSATSDWFQVQNEVMEAQDTDGEVIWESPVIDVSTLTSTVSLSIDFSEEGNLENADYAKAYYVLDGGAEVEFATNGNNANDFTAVVAEQSLTFSGSNTTLKIVIRVKNNAGGEYIRFDNVSVSELSPCTEPSDQGTSLSLTSSATSITGSFTVAASSPDNYIVIISTASSLSASPVDATSYNINDAIGGGTVVTKTSINSFSATDLNQGTQYYFYVFSYNSNCTGGPNYNTTSPLTGNTTTETVPNIMITEIMLNPNTVSDANGEYFELYNNSGGDVDINGWVIKDNGSNNHTINAAEGTLVITNGGFLILARNDDNATNGGVTAQYKLSTSFSLTNSDDEIILINSAGIEVDRVEYDDEAGFPNPNGASMYLTNINLDNNISSSWAASTVSTGFTIPTPDKGSPGVTGETSLPVELISFSAQQVKNNVLLKWQTASELNNSHFEIEHSNDGFNFEIIGERNGNETTTRVSDYSFLHDYPTDGLNYYRLKQIDFNQAFEYSPIKIIRIENHQSHLKIFPNPTSQILNIELSDDWTSETTLEVYDITGKLVQSHITSNTLNTFDLSHLPNGQYLLKVTNASRVLIQRFVKSN